MEVVVVDVLEVAVVGAFCQYPKPPLPFSEI